MKTTIYYSVQNGGDGSAYPMFVETKELARWDQDHMDEGWGECCSGELVIESDGPITVNDVMTEFGYMLQHFDFEDLLEKEPDENNKKEFIDFKSKFFPNGLPEFNVVERSLVNPDKYHYHDIYVDGKKVADIFTSECIEDTLKNITRMYHV